MNKVFFDLSACQPNRESKYHGGGVYGYIVFRELMKIAPERVAVYFSRSRFLEPDVLALIEKNDVPSYDSDRISIIEAYRQSGCSKIYTPLYVIHHKKAVEEGIPFMVTVHGIRALEMFTDKDEVNYARSFRDKVKAYIKLSPLGKLKWRSYYRKYQNLFNSKNVGIVTVSNHSKYSMKTFYPHSDVDKISVYYSPSTTIEGYERFLNTSSQKYYLIISANRWLKNAGRAIQALDLLFDTNPALSDHVKVLGLKQDTGIYRRIRHKDKFELLGYQTQEELERLYAGAYAFIYPTLNEGFGYPPLEAMKYGTPVISSPFTSIPEVCGDAVLYANPYSVEEIANRVLQLEDEKRYNYYREKSLERYARIFDKQKSDLNSLCNILLK